MYAYQLAYLLNVAVCYRSCQITKLAQVDAEGLAYLAEIRRADAQCLCYLADISLNDRLAQLREVCFSYAESLSQLLKVNSLDPRAAPMLLSCS